MRSVLATLAGAALLALVSTGSASAFFKMPSYCTAAVVSTMYGIALVYDGPLLCGFFAVDVGTGGTNPPHVPGSVKEHECTYEWVREVG